MIDLSLLEDFIEGAVESLEEMETALLELETSPDDNELLNTIFRAMHTIKGAAQFVGLEKVSALSHALEDLLDLLREGKKQATLEIIDILIQAKDRINLLVNDLESSQTEKTDVDDLIAQLGVHLSVEPAVDETEGEDVSSFLSEEDEGEDVASFLTEENEGEDVSSFLSEDDEGEDVSSFLSEEDEGEDVASFLTEESEDEDVSSLLPDIGIEQREDEASLSSDDNDDFILPEEEYDQELFGIFILQLQEKFSILNNSIAKLESADNKNELLNDIVEALESIKFSANYMAYEKLTHIYSGWIDEVLDAQESLAATGEVSFAFMNEYLLKLRSIFPQLEGIETPTEVIDTTVVEDSLLPTALIDALDIKDEENAELAFINDLVNQNEKTDELEDSDEEPAEADDLFDKLSSALDASLIEQSITSEPINEVFGALLDSTEKQREQVKAEKEKDLTLEVKTLAEVNEEAPKKAESSADLKADAKVVEEPVKPLLQKESKVDDAPTKSATPSPDKVFRKSIRVDADKIDSLMNQVGELIVDRAYFFQLATEISELQQYLKEAGLGQKDLKPVRTFAYRFSEAIISLGRTSNELQEGVMKVRMLPIAQIFNRYPRLVHDVAHTNNKKVRLEIRGEETELDKMIIEEISDPLIHMIRNAIGHGIESPEERVKAGKPETGVLLLEAFHESNHIVIEVTDDGRGIDTDRIKAKAEAIKLFSKEELDRMSDADLTRFIMMPGFSTAKEIDSTSGRGVGMDVVKKNIEKLNGTIEVESKKGVETKMRLKIPLTLAIIQALLVKVGVDSFTIPLANVEETLKVSDSDVSIMEDTEVMYLRGKTVPIFRLATLFGLQSDDKASDLDFFVVIVNTGTQKIGLMVDALIGQEEVVIKPLADYLHEQNCFSGATIIGDGRISLILDVYELVNMTTERQIKKHHEQERKSLASLENGA
ncbi:MAG: hypothetical protein GQ569_01755 [Methylococcaceae bacterium]|nr:hypothetical protein [Methylococcaceae bacterium]